MPTIDKRRINDSANWTIMPNTTEQVYSKYASTKEALWSQAAVMRNYTRRLKLEEGSVVSQFIITSLMYPLPFSTRVANVSLVTFRVCLDWGGSSWVH